MRAYSLDLRVRVLADYDAGMTFAQVARKYTVSAEWVRRIVRRREQTGEVAARPPVNRRVPFHRRHEAELRSAMAEDSSLTLEALRTKLGVECDLSTLWYALRALKISFKKRRSSPRSSSGPRSSRNATNSKSGKSASPTRTASSSSTRPGSKAT
jgi:transposase